jgi:hypothetical protein
VRYYLCKTIVRRLSQSQPILSLRTLSAFLRAEDAVISTTTTLSSALANAPETVEISRCSDYSHSDQSSEHGSGLTFAGLSDPRCHEKALIKPQESGGGKGLCPERPSQGAKSNSSTSKARSSRTSSRLLKDASIAVTLSSLIQSTSSERPAL